MHYITYRTGLIPICLDALNTLLFHATMLLEKDNLYVYYINHYTKYIPLV